MFGPPDRAFRETRYLLRGPLGQMLCLTGAGMLVLSLFPFAGATSRILVAASGSVVVLAATVARVQTELTSTSLLVRVVPLRTRRIPLEDIAAAEVVMADNLTMVFGGWNGRTSLGAALATEAEGDQSVGNRAVRVRRTDGSMVQVGSWRPWTLRDAIRQACL